MYFRSFYVEKITFICLYFRKYLCFWLYLTKTLRTSEKLLENYIILHRFYTKIAKEETKGEIYPALMQAAGKVLPPKKNPLKQLTFTLSEQIFQNGVFMNADKIPLYCLQQVFFSSSRHNTFTGSLGIGTPPHPTEERGTIPAGLETKLATAGYQIQNAPGDGNCAFYAYVL